VKVRNSKKGRATLSSARRGAVSKTPTLSDTQTRRAEDSVALPHWTNSQPHVVCRTLGITLIECLLYIALFFVVASLAFASYFRVHDETRALSRNTDDIIRAMQAGERWRADVRAATTKPVIENDVLRLKTRSGDVLYLLRDGTVSRQAGQSKAVPVLERVKRSTVQADPRQHVTAWRWELELQPRRAQTSVHPLFTFTAVPENEVTR